jgi:CRP-like cAMP-binding protein
VAALTPLWLLTLDRAPFDALLRRHPELRAALGAGAELMLRTDFLKAASPFATPPPGRLRDLAAGLAELAVPAGGDLVREGQPGESCYLLRRGRAVVLRREGATGAEQAVAELAAGAIVGEAALLDGAPRAATVRAVEDCTLLALRRDDLLAALGADPAPGAQLGGLARWRARPRRAPGVEAYRRATSTGETIATLKDRARGAYYRLAPRGWFLWERLDGERTMRELARDYLAAFRDAGPDAVAEVIAGLAGAGFVEGIALRADAGPLRRVRRLLG